MSLCSSVRVKPRSVQVFRLRCHESRTRGHRESLPQGQWAGARTRRTFFAEVLGPPPDSKIATPSANSLSGGWRQTPGIGRRFCFSGAGHVSCSTSPPTISISKGSDGWKSFCIRAIRLRGRQAMTAISSKTSPRHGLELSRPYEDGYLRRAGNYRKFLDTRKINRHAQQKHHTPSKIVSQRLEWLRRGPRLAPQIQSTHRQSPELMVRISPISRPQPAHLRQHQFFRHNRQTRHSFNSTIRFCFGGRQLFENIRFSITSGMRSARRP